MDFCIVGMPGYLAHAVAQKIGKHLITPQITQFADGEIEASFSDPNILKNKKVFIIQSTSAPVHDNLMILLSLIFEAKNAGAAQVVPVIPYFGYSRHDKGVIPGTQGTVALIASMIESAGADAIITVELHSEKIKDLFTIPVITLSLADLIGAHIKSVFGNKLEKICLVAPDLGAQERVSVIAHALNVGHIFFTKKRTAPDTTQIVASDSQCTGTIAIIIDDIIDTGGTALNACTALKGQGFEEVYGYFIHPVLSHNAVSIIESSAFSHVYVSNSIPLTSSLSKIGAFDIADVLASVILKTTL